MKNNTVHTFFSELFSANCKICQQQRVVDASVCDCCFSHLPYAKHACQFCGEALSGNSQNKTCLNCLSQPVNYQQMLACFNYEGVIASLINQAKSAKNISSVNCILDIMIKKLQQNKTFLTWISGANKPYLLAMPTTKSRLIKRGFNLPQFMASHLSKRFGLPVVNGICIKTTFFAKKQSKQNRKSRLKARHNYYFNSELPSQLIIVDDVLSTGTTVTNLAKVIMHRKHTNIKVIAFSKTQSTHKKQQIDN